MKKVASLIFIGILANTSCFFFTTSCAPTVSEDYDSPYTSYINDRTFSIATIKDGYIYFGTAWIFKKVDLNIEHFTYYLATNVHVAAPFSQSSYPQMYLGYNPNYRNSIRLRKPSGRDPFDYFSISSTNYELLGEDSNNDNDHMRPIIVPETAYQNQRYECDVDFDVFKVDFGNELNVVNNDPFRNGPLSPLLDRLTKLNDECWDNRTLDIVNFATSSERLKINTSLHVAGYPYLSYRTDKFATWTSYHTYSYSFDFNNNPTSPFIPISPIENEKIKFKDGVDIAIVGKIVSFMPSSTNNLLGGSSGSLVINDQYQAVAIHFAGNTVQNFAIILNTDDNYYNGNNSDDAHNKDKYEVLNYFPNII